jgi:hypothetical protein
MKNAKPNLTPFVPPSRTVELVAPPPSLSAEAVERWRTFQAEYGIHDSGGLGILLLHVEALMTARACEATLLKDGLTTKDRFGQARAHPAAVICAMRGRQCWPPYAP